MDEPTEPKCCAQVTEATVLQLAKQKGFQRVTLFRCWRGSSDSTRPNHDEPEPWWSRQLEAVQAALDRVQVNGQQSA